MRSINPSMSVLQRTMMIINNRHETSNEQKKEEVGMFNLIFVQIYSGRSIDLRINQAQAIILAVNLVQCDCIHFLSCLDYSISEPMSRVRVTSSFLPLDSKRYKVFLSFSIFLFSSCRSFSLSVSLSLSRSSSSSDLHLTAFSLICLVQDTHR